MSHAKQLHHRRYLNDYPEMINRRGLPGHVKTRFADGLTAPSPQP